MERESKSESNHDSEGITEQINTQPEQNIIMGRTGKKIHSYRGNHRSGTKGAGIKAFFRNNWMKKVI